MDVREKLVELVNDVLMYLPWGEIQNDTAERIVDRMMDHDVTVQEWISVKDKLPEEKVDCIVHYKHAYCDNDDYWAIGMCFYDGEKFRIGCAYKVTHWMPLPHPPADKSNQEVPTNEMPLY